MTDVAKKMNGLLGSMQLNAVYLMANSLGITIFGFMFWVVAGRYYDVAEMGIAAAIISAAMLISLLSTIGFDFSIVRYLADSNQKSMSHVVNSCLTLALATSIALSTSFLIVVWGLLPDLHGLVTDVYQIIFFFVFVIAGTLSPIINSALIAKSEARFVLVREVGIAGTLKLALVMALTSLGVLGMTASWAVAALASLLAGLVFVLPKVLKTWKPELSVDKQTVSSMMKFSLSNYLGNLFYIGPSLFLPIVITVMLSVDETAYFRISWLFASILSIIPSASAFSLYAEGSVGPGTTGPKVKTATLFTFGLLLPALAVMLIFGHDLLSFVGQEYADNAFSSLKVFALASIPLAANTIYIAVKRIEKDSVAILWVYGVMAALFLSLSWLTMTHQRLDGIANSWLATQIVISALIAIVELKKMLVRKSNVQPSE